MRALGVALALAVSLALPSAPALQAAPALASSAATSTIATTATAPTHTETIHTTANHPWLTADRGWVQASDLRAGEAVVTLDVGAGSGNGGSGATATVVWVHAEPGQANMYNLTVAHDHTYAVGTSQAVVHNNDLICDPQPYEGKGGGHHIHSRKAFEGIADYDENAALAIRNDDMSDNGWYHPAMTAKQQQLFLELGARVANGTARNTMLEHNRIAVEALMAGNVPEAEARGLVARSLWNLRSMGQDGARAPNWIPWFGGPYPGTFG